MSDCRFGVSPVNYPDPDPDPDPDTTATAFSSRSFQTWVISALSRFGLGRFGLSRFGPG